MGVPISSLPASSTLTGTESLPVVQSGTTKKTTIADVVASGFPVTTAKIADANVTLEKLAAAVIQNLVPAGAVNYFAMTSAPAGWLKANGAAVSRTTYATLFSAIGTTFGAGDGSTTFNLPELRAEFIRSLDDGRGIESRTLGSSQGAYAGSFTVDASSDDGDGQTGSFRSVSNLSFNGTQFITNGSGTGTVSPTPGDTRPRNVALLACIKY